MNGGLRFLAVAFLLAFCYHWLTEDDWSDLEEDNYKNQDFMRKFSQSFQQQSGDQVIKGNERNDEADLDGLHSRQVLLEEIRHSCLPRLVCELFAMEDKSSLSESELSLMTLISQTSLGTRANPSSNYHFAAHMGQLLVGIDGNGCQNFYPLCPLAGNQALALARKIKIR